MYLVPCEGLADAIETDNFKKQEEIVSSIYDAYKDKEIDAIVLGCTHYPLIQNKIRRYLPEGIKILSQGEIVAKSLKDYLERHSEMEEKCSKNATTMFYTTESPEKFSASASIFLHKNIQANHINIA